jgi:hypothetical protein
VSVGAEADAFYDAELRAIIKVAFSRLHLRLRSAGSSLCLPTIEWMRSLSGGDEPERYFMHPFAFPMLLLPWWLEHVIRGDPESDFQTDVTYSTLNGYYFVRMIDDLMDRDRPPAAEVLPALVFLHTEFQSSYFAHFPNGHGFWSDFSAVSFASAEMASRDASLTDLSRAQFLAVSSRKVAGAKVPIAAICHKYGRPDLLVPWFELVDRLGRWHQMLNDVLDWSRDLDHQRHTYFLSEASRRRGPTVSVAEWVVGEGLKWGSQQVERWADELAAGAQELGSPALVRYLEQRRTAADVHWRSLIANLEPLQRLAATMRAGGLSADDDD